jgi:hypothetical protein
MANEIQINATLRYSKSPTSASLATSFFDDQIGDKYGAGVQIVGTTEEQLNKGDIGTIGYLAFRNLDATNYVELGKATGAYTIKVLPGKGGVVPWGAGAVYMLANTAPVELEYLAIEL